MRPVGKAITMTANPDSSDREFLDLLQQARRGDQRALGQLINRYRPYLLRIAYDEADTGLQAKDGDSDYVQDACVKAICAFHRFHGGTAREMRGWLRTILLGQINSARKQALAKKRNIRAEVPLQSIDAGDSHNEKLAVTKSSPPEQAVHQEERAILETALEDLSELDRVIFEMRQKDGCAFVEIARQLNLSEEAAQKRWARALNTLKQKVSRLDDRFLQ
jgi:RNA polymerase sigma-70 factor, ECF subfamily